MLKFVKNFNELDEIIRTMDDAECDYKVYQIVYTALYVFADENGETDDYETMVCAFVVDDSDDSEDDFRAKAFIEVEKQYLAKSYREFAVDRVNETIDIISFGGGSTHIYGFWNTAALSKEAVELIAGNING